MEPMTYILTGACISGATLKSKMALSTVTMVIAAEIADVDLLYSLRGRVVGFQHHRGWTHSVAAMPLMADFPLRSFGYGTAVPQESFQSYCTSSSGPSSHASFDRCCSTATPVSPRSVFFGRHVHN